MKISDQLFQEMKEGFQKIIDAFGKDKMIEWSSQFKTNAGFMWNVWHMVQFDWTSTDDHPFYLNGRKRYNPYRDRMWTIYKDGIHDAHIETALKKICTQLGLPHESTNSKVYPRKP